MDVAIVNHETRDHLRTCLSTVSAAASAGAVGRILVADNGSSDGSLDMVRTEFPDVIAVSLPHNPGFGAAANELIRRSSADHVLLLNADVRIGADAATQLARHLDRHPCAAVVGPALVDDTGAIQRSHFEFPSVTGLLRRESGAHRWFPGADTSSPVPGDPDASDVAWVLGAALAIRRVAFDGVGGFDPGYFLYFEEVDLCRRLRDAGWQVHLQPAATAAHTGGASTRRTPGGMQRVLYRSLHRYHRLHGGASITALRLAVAAIMTARLVRHTALGLRPGAAGRAARSAPTVWPTVLGDAVRGWSR